MKAKLPDKFSPDKANVKFPRPTHEKYILVTVSNLQKYVAINWILR